jgi:hypothetical protein
VLDPGRAERIRAGVEDGVPGTEYTTHVTHVVLVGRIVCERAEEVKQAPMLRSRSAFPGGQPEYCMRY